MVNVSEIFIAMIKYRIKQVKRRKYLFCTMVSEISVHSPWLCYFQAPGEVENYGRKLVMRLFASGESRVGVLFSRFVFLPCPR